MAGEADIKALDKRVGGIERKLDELDKSLRAAGDFKALEARVKALEQICKTLMEARTESKATAARMIADVAKLNDQTLSADTVKKLMDQERKAADAQALAQAKAAEAAARTLTDKVRADGEAMTRKLIDQQFKAVVEARLTAVEQMAKAALAKK